MPLRPVSVPWPLVAALAVLPALASAQPSAGLLSLLAPARLQPATDSFAVVVQGAPRGWERYAVARDGDGWRVRDDVAIGAMVAQSSAITIDAAGHERALQQDGTMRGTAMRIRLAFADGRATGSALTPSNPSGPLAIDVAVPDGTVDDNAVLPLLAALPWREGLDVAFPVLASGKGTVSTYRLRVLGADSTTVLAGHFDTWRAELTTGETALTLHVARGERGRIVRIQAAGSPMDLQRVR